MKSNFKSKILVVLILILMISVNIAFFQQTRYSEVYNNPLKEDNPKLNAPDITINTPENKTYTKPMSGYYPGIYGFENDINGNDPQEWNDTSGTGCDCYVVDSTDTHNKVLRFYDNSVSTRTDIEVSLPYQTHGTIEYWVYGSMVGSPYDRFYAYLYDGTNPTILVVSSEGIWNYGPRGATWEQLLSLPSIQADTWQHLCIHFEMGDSGYMGLGPDQFELIVDGVSSGALDTWAVGSGIDKNRFFTINEDFNQNWYIDAFGYSWHTNYNVGDNLNEGLLLSFENSTSLDWIGFSLDEQTNKTILGNFTLPMPGEGLHNIQVFGNDSMGDNYESDQRYFSVKAISIITPENKTYTGPISGYYQGIYGFENDINGNNPQEWIDTSGLGCDCYVVDSIDTHNKVLRLYDNSASTRTDIEVSLPYQTYGTVEYWVYGSMLGSPYDRFYAYLYDGTNPTILVVSSEGIWNYGPRGGTWEQLLSLPSIQADTWQHLRIHFEMGNSGYMGLGPDQFELIVDGVSSGALDTYAVGSGIDKNRYFTINEDFNQNWYIDAFGYTGDMDYNIGDNLNEGLLLSFENSISLDWIGFSLDGQANDTILGNTTVPFPEDGQHTIQVFGNDSIGINYDSDIRYFSVKFIQINLITPQNITYTEPMSGYYPATYGFENDINGNNPQEWNDISGTGCDCYVVDSAGDHNKVLRLYDNSVSNRADIEISLPYQTRGTIEYWVYGSMSGSPYDRFYSYIYEGGNPNIQVITTDGTWYYGQRGGGWVALPSLPSIQAGTWQHIRIHFEMGNSGYMGLSPDQFELVVDGVSSGALDTAMVGSGIDRDRFFTIAEDVNQNWYIDAFGYTGDVDYNIGDNLNEGILLSFENSSILDWIGYSLDGQFNKTILGNTTIPIPENGLHTIQIFGSISEGFIYESDIVYFTINISEDQTPPNGSEDINYLLVIILIGILSLIGIVVVGIIYSRVHLPSEKPKSKRRKLKETKEKDISIELIHCPFCHSEIIGGQKFCNYCGANLKDDASV